MNFIRTQIAWIQQQLQGLDASQRMLAAALTVIIAMTLVWWIVYAGRPEMQPLLDQSMTQEDIAVISAELTARAIGYKVNADRILVPADRRTEALAALSYAGKLPRSTSTGFDAMLAKLSPFAPSSTQQAVLNQAKQNYLANIIRDWPGVLSADVVIDPTYKPGFNGAVPKATVNIVTRGAPSDPKRLVTSAADFVAGTTARLTRSNVSVILNAQSYPLRDPDDAAGMSDLLDRVQAAENLFRTRLRETFSFVPGVIVAVSVQHDSTTESRSVRLADRTQSLQMPLSESVTTSTSSSGPRSEEEPGVLSNAPAAIGVTASLESSSTSNRTERTEFENYPALTQITTTKPAGDIRPSSATVLIPRSYFEHVFRDQQGLGPDSRPDPAQLEQFIGAQIPRFRAMARGALGNIAEEAIQVQSIADLMPLALQTPAPATTSLPAMVGSHAREIALGVLALVSLVMVSNIVRKGAAAPAAAAPTVSRPVPALNVAEEAVGEVGEGAPPLDGMELDEDSVKARQMLHQVSEMVADNPDAAAKLVKRWLHHA